MTALYYNLDDFLKELAPEWKGDVEFAFRSYDDDDKVKGLSISGWRSDTTKIHFWVGFPGATEEEVREQRNRYQSLLETFLAERKKANDELLMESIPGYVKPG